jgi:hypothetical protein
MLPRLPKWVTGRKCTGWGYGISSMVEEMGPQSAGGSLGGVPLWAKTLPADRDKPAASTHALTDFSINNVLDISESSLIFYCHLSQSRNF